METDNKFLEFKLRIRINSLIHRYNVDGYTQLELEDKLIDLFNDFKIRSSEEIESRLKVALEGMENCYSPIRHDGGERMILPMQNRAYEKYVIESSVLLWVLNAN